MENQSQQYKNNFNPIKEDKDGVMAKRMIWSTQAIAAAYEGLKQGRKLVANPFYENNTKLLKGDLNFERTEEEIAEWKRCKNDIIYFANKYCKLMTPQGVQHIELRDYQVEYLRHIIKNRLSIFLSCRQSGKTTTSSLFMLHYILFNFDKNALVLGNKRRTAVEILDKAKSIFYELPFFLRPGIYKWNEGEIVLDNGCRLMAEATTINSGISFTFHCVLADEFAHIQPNILDKFYNNLFPTITAGKARFMITSTQNGFNLFYKLYTAAVAGENEYAPFKVDWWQVPEWNPDKQCWEQRTEEWHRMQVANYGGEENFNKQFGTEFCTTNDTLISNHKLRMMSEKEVKYVNKELNGVLNEQYYFWHPDFNPMDELHRHRFVITIDISEGIGGDYTVFQICKIENGEGDKVVYKNIGYYRNNKGNVEVCVNDLYSLCFHHMTMGKYLISIEYNLYGELFYKTFLNLVESNPDNISIINESVFILYPKDEGGNNYQHGIRMTSKTKLMACASFKNDIEKGIIEDYDVLFINELKNFTNNGNNSFSAINGHDDMVMALLQLSLARQQKSVKLLEGLSDSGQNNMINIYAALDNYNNQMLWDTMMNEDSKNKKRFLK